MFNFRTGFAALLVLFVLTVISPGAAWAKEPTLIKFETSLGDFVIELDEKAAPKTCANFMEYVNSGFFEGTIFHRVIGHFMIQGGGFDVNMAQKPTLAPVENEANNGLKNDAYTVAMARTADPHSATSQFFVNVADNDFLNHKAKNANGWGYCVFGKVVKGQDVIDKIKGVPTRSKGFHDDVPTIPVVIEKVVKL